MNIPDDDFKSLEGLINTVIDGPDQGRITRDQVERAEYDLVLLMRKLGGRMHGQKIDYLTRKFTTP